MTKPTELETVLAAPEELSTEVVIIGGGPAGAMLGWELAKLGRQVVVVEKSTHYERNYRGESISPDSIEILKATGIMADLNSHGFLITEKMEIHENGEKLLTVDFGDFKYPSQFPVDVPQTILLEAIIRRAETLPNFKIIRGYSVDSLIEENGEVQGAICKSKSGKIVLKSQLIVGADGRYSKVRKLGNFDFDKRPVERDVIWLKVDRPKDWGDVVKVKIEASDHLIILPTYPDSLRVGINIAKGGYKHIRGQDISVLHDKVSRLEPLLAEEVKKDIKAWSDTSLLDIFSTTVSTWYRPGLVLMGDAAHTLTPVLGQGVNHAIQDAMVLAPIVANALTENPGHIVGLKPLKAYQKLREGEVNFVQKVQLRQERVFGFSGAVSTLARRSLYRFINTQFWAKDLLWGRIYYRQQRDAA